LLDHFQNFSLGIESYRFPGSFLGSIYRWPLPNQNQNLVFKGVFTLPIGLGYPVEAHHPGRESI